jgi:DNA repair protein RecO (recombination protein O)
LAGRRTYRTGAIVLAHTKLAEQDLILTLLSEEGEQLRAVAKGARKPGGRLAARVELFSETDFLLARGRSLDVVSEAQVTCAHAGLRGDLERVSAASAAAEVARLTSFEDARDPYLHAILSRALTALEEAPDQGRLDLAVAAYAIKVLAHSGWRPELDSCVACGDASVTFFSAPFGGALCSSCARNVAGAEPVDARTLAWLRALLGATFDELGRVEVDVATSTELLSIAHVWAATHLDARLRAFEFMLSL